MKTTKAILNALFQNLSASYDSQMAALPLKKGVRETLSDGFKDGLRAGIDHTIKMLGVEVES